MPLDALRHAEDPGIPSAEREMMAAARAERRWRHAAAQRGALYVKALIGWLIIVSLVLGALVAL